MLWATIKLAPMSTKLMLRVTFAYQLLNTLVLYLFPAKLITSLFLLPYSWLLRSPSSQEKSIVPSNEPTMSSSTNASGIDISELKGMFQMFDRNGDGRITKKELSESLEKLGIYIPEGELMGMVDKIDVNGDGCVDIEEFGKLYQTIMEERVEDEDEDILEAFNVFDQNRDGFISVEELRLVLGSLGVKQGTTVEDCKKMITQTDVDGDGMVNFKEFKQMMRGSGFAAIN